MWPRSTGPLKFCPEAARRRVALVDNSTMWWAPTSCPMVSAAVAIWWSCAADGGLGRAMPGPIVPDEPFGV